MRTSSRSACLLVAIALAGLGCGGDSDVLPATDAGLDAGPPSAQVDAGAGVEDPGDGRGCIDFEDGDGDGAVDCADSDCHARPICCVGSDEGHCCSPMLFRQVAFADCSGAGTEALIDCLDGATAFGSPAPELRAGAFVPQGGARTDAGLRLRDNVDPRIGTVVLEATVRTRTACTTCLESVGMGLTRASTDAASTPSLDLGAVVSSSRQEIQLLLGGAVARSVDFSAFRSAPASPEESWTLRLELSPAGALTLHVSLGDATHELTTRYDAVGPMQILLWGRSTNRAAGSEASAALHEFQAQHRICDVPSALSRRATTILPDDVDLWWPSRLAVRSPSVAVYEVDGQPRSLMAFEVDGRIHLAGGLPDGRFRAFADPSLPATAALAASPAEPFRAGGVGDPELVVRGDHLELWFTARDTEGRPSIGRAIGLPGFALQFDRVTQILPDASHEGAWDSPAYLEFVSSDGETVRLLAARKDATEIVVLPMDADDLPAHVETTLSDSFDGLTYRRQNLLVATGSPERFDADEVDDPDLVFYRGVVRLYYAGRRGTRWAIGLAASEDGRHWLTAEGGRPVLRGDPSSFDTLSVRSPSPVIEDGFLRLYYGGSDGLREVIGLAQHLLPSTP